VKSIDDKQAADTGMAAVLVFLLIGYWGPHSPSIAIAIVLLLVNMVFPSVYKPLAVVWLGLSSVLGTIASRILLTLLFFLLVTPIGWIRRLLGADAMRSKEWKKEKPSVFKVVDHTYVSSDLEKPY
jgi:hypothetical protein